MPELQEKLWCVGPSHWPTWETSLCPVQSRDRCLSSEYSYNVSQPLFFFLSLLLLMSAPAPFVTQTHAPSLEERKERWRKEEEERRRNAPDPSAPAGHTLMPERERQETLKSLKECMPLLLFVLILTMTTVTKSNVCAESNSVVAGFSQLIAPWWLSCCHFRSKLTIWVFAREGLSLIVGFLKSRRPLRYSQGTKFT